MKKVLIIIIILLVTTGCTCEYNLNIENGKYSEEVIITARTVSEKNEFSREWQIPTDKEEYSIGLDMESSDIKYDNIYDYRTSGNSLIFTHDFSRSDYNNSTAVYNCYNKLAATYQSGSTIISTSNMVQCFDKYPDLTNIKVNITVDKEVKDNNADSVSGNTYTWNISRSDADNKPINLVLKDPNDTIVQPETTTSSNVGTAAKKDYSVYIFLAIILVIFLIGYAIFNKLKNKEEKI